MSCVDEVFGGIVRFRMASVSVGKGLAGQGFDDVRRIAGRAVSDSWCVVGRNARMLVVSMFGMAMVVVFEIFKDVADIKESVAVEADVHESRLHAGEDAGDFAFVDAAD